jgi:hypothetical protein
LDARVQIPGARYIWGWRSYAPDSAIPAWRAIRDDKGRIVVAICHNSDVGMGMSHQPQYPERAASLAYRIGINYVIFGNIPSLAACDLSAAPRHGEDSWLRDRWPLGGCHLGGVTQSGG